MKKIESCLPWNAPFTSLIFTLHKATVRQFQIGVEVKVHAFKSMRERDVWVQEHYDALGARQCSVVEAKQLAKSEDIIEH